MVSWERFVRTWNAPVQAKCSSHYNMVTQWGKEITKYSQGRSFSWISISKTQKCWNSWMLVKNRSIKKFLIQMNWKSCKNIQRNIHELTKYTRKRDEGINNGINIKKQWNVQGHFCDGNNALGRELSLNLINWTQPQQVHGLLMKHRLDVVYRIVKLHRRIWGNWWYLSGLANWKNS